MNKHNNKKLDRKQQKKLNEKRIARKTRARGLKEYVENDKKFLVRQHKKAVLERIREQQEEKVKIKSESIKVKQNTETIQL